MKYLIIYVSQVYGLSKQPGVTSHVICDQRDLCRKLTEMENSKLLVVQVLPLKEAL